MSISPEQKKQKVKKIVGVVVEYMGYNFISGAVMEKIDTLPATDIIYIYNKIKELMK